MIFDESWIIVDSRTREQMTVATFLSQDGALRQIKEWKERDKRGIRPDCRPYLPFLVPEQAR